MPETPAEPTKDLWTTFLDFLSQIITPAWGDLILLLPFVFALLAVGFVLLMARRWRQAGAINRSRVPARLSSGAPPPGIHLPGPSRWPFVVPIGATFILFALALRPRGSGLESAGLPFNVPLMAIGLLVTLVSIGGWLYDAMREWRRTEGLEGDAGHGVTLVTAGASTGAARGHQGDYPMEPQVARAAAVVGTNTMTPAHPAIAALTHRADRAPDELPPGIHLPGPSGWPFLAPIALMFIFFGLVLGPALLIGGIVMGVIAAVGWLRDAGQEYHQTDAGGSVEPPSRDPQRALPFSLLKLYMGIAALSIVAIVGPSVITGVITRPAAGAPSGTAAPSGVPGNELSISARLIAFDTDRLLAPADQPFTILFDNQEAAPHNVTIFQGADPNAPVVLREDPFSGPQQVVYDVGPLAAGSYYFHCDVHPNMKGTLDAR